MDATQLSITSALLTAIMTASIFGGVTLFAHGLDTKQSWGKRLAALALVLATFFVCLNINGSGEMAGYFQEFLLFTIILLICIAFVLLYWDTTIWGALFCVTAGYSLQNLSSGLTELINAVEETLGFEVWSGSIFWANSILPIVVTYALAYLLVVRKVEAERLNRIEDHSMLLMLPVVILVIIGFDLTIKSMTEDGLELFYVIILRVMHALACVFVIWIEFGLLYQHRLEDDMATAEKLLAERDRQYEQSRESIDAINLKCHDIKHQIRTLSASGAAVDPAALADLEHEVEIYDSFFETGNEALDTILTEKGLVCEQQDISLTCLADGSALNFMASADLYALFGNALDNAMCAVSELEPEQRTISVSVKRAMEAVSIHIENPFDGNVNLEDGLPTTTKDDTANHGFGMRSMLDIANRYDGTLSVIADKGVFCLDVLIPAQ